MNRVNWRWGEFMTAADFATLARALLFFILGVTLGSALWEIVQGLKRK